MSYGRSLRQQSIPDMLNARLGTLIKLTLPDGI